MPLLVANMFEQLLFSRNVAMDTKYMISVLGEDLTSVEKVQRLAPWVPLCPASLVELCMSPKESTQNSVW